MRSRQGLAHPPARLLSPLGRKGHIEAKSKLAKHQEKDPTYPLSLKAMQELDKPIPEPFIVLIKVKART